jgi:hypothetical protein
MLVAVVVFRVMEQPLELVVLAAAVVIPLEQQTWVAVEVARHRQQEHLQAAPAS